MPHTIVPPPRALVPQSCTHNSKTSLPRSVALFGLRGTEHFERIACGVEAFCQQTGRLQITRVLTMDQLTRNGEHGSRVQPIVEGVDAFITTSTSPCIADLIRGRGLPTVMVSARTVSEGFARVLPDDGLVGKLAAEFLLERGFEHFAFYGLAGFAYSERRRSAFSARLMAAGHRINALDVEGIWKDRTMAADQADHSQLLTWLSGLPKPCGVFCANDGIACKVMQVAVSIGVSIPDELSLLGVDNEPAYQICPPLSLSSIALDSHGQGHRAACLVDRILCGEQPPPAPIWIAPGAVIARASTEIAFASDPTVRRALAVMHARFREPIGISEVAQACHVSRRLMEVRFRECLHRSPRQELERIRLNEARRLLGHCDKNLDEVAEMTGFSHAGLLIVRFRALFGETPGKYRARNNKW